MDVDSHRRITSLESVPAATTTTFTVRPVENGDPLEAVLVRTSDGEVRAWLNYCRHLLDVRIDKGSGAPMRDGEIVCANHGAYFDSDTGYCTFGPCEGATLVGVDVTVADGAVYLTDDEYVFVADGPMDDGDDGPSPTSAYEF